MTLPWNSNAPDLTDMNIPYDRQTCSLRVVYGHMRTLATWIRCVEWRYRAHELFHASTCACLMEPRHS